MSANTKSSELAGTGVSRRALVQGAGWSVPVVVVVALPSSSGGLWAYGKSDSISYEHFRQRPAIIKSVA
jgi:hypothetical protein